jgi:hypothetical protein
MEARQVLKENHDVDTLRHPFSGELAMHGSIIPSEHGESMFNSKKPQILRLPHCNSLSETAALLEIQVEIQG